MTAFTYTGYRYLLEQFQERGYEFAEFSDAEELLYQQRRFVLLRHDIDMDLGKALQMARLEAHAGAQATYFFMLRTDHYNLFSQSGTETVKQILSLGHRLGLHFDVAAYDFDNEEDPTAAIAAAVRREAQLMGQWFDESIDVMSFHRPSPIVLQGDPLLSTPLWHTYMKCYTQEMSYLSDSRGTFRYGHPLESPALAEGRPIHLLTHPVWWSNTGTTPQQALRHVIDRKQKQFRQSLAANCQVMLGDDSGRAA